MTTDRYDRQQRIQNWQQEKLARARVAIVGSGQLAQFTAGSLAALGIGNIRIYEDGSKGFLNSIAENGELETILHQMNPEVEIRVERGTDIQDKPDLILDLTNSPETKERTLKYAHENRVRALSASTGNTQGELHFDEEGAKLESYRGKQQGAFTSEIFGGMITEEVRKELMPIREGEKPVEKLAYNATSEKRFTEQEDFEAMPYEDLSQKKVLIVGAGALGNFVALGAALEGIGHIDILDFDEVESHNLNRQILFYDAVGKNKAEALAQKIRKINPQSEVKGLVGKLDETTTFKEGQYDLILDCVDNFATRAIANYFAVRYGIPLVSGGTNSRAGQVVVYEPGQSACIECKLGVERALGTQLQGASCLKQTDPSVIMTNEIIGGMMIGEALKVLDRGYGAPVSKMLKYDSQIDVRGGILGPEEACDCKRPEMKEWLAEVKDRYADLGGKK